MRSSICKLSKFSGAVKSSVALFLASLVTKGIAYLTTPIYTRILTPDQFGQVSVFLTWQNVLGIVAMFCLMNGVFNNGMVDNPNERDAYSFSMLGLSNVITIVFAAVFFIAYAFYRDLINLPLSFLVLMFVLYTFQPAYNFWAAKQRYELKWKALVIWSLVLAFVSPIVAIFCILFLETDKLASRIFGAEIPMILIYILFYIYIAYKNKFKIDTRFWKGAFLFNLPLIPHYLSNLLMTSADTLMIARMVDYTSTAYYGVAFSISSIIAVMWSSVNASLIPYTYEKCKADDYISISRVTMPILWSFALICFGLILLGPEILRIMGTKEYMEAIYVIPPIIAGVFFQVQYYVYGNVVFYYKKPIFVMIGSVTATILNIVLNYIFIPIYGYIAAAYTTLFAYMIQALIDYYAMKYVVGKSIYNLNQILILSLVILVGTILSLFLYDYNIIRYVFLVIIFSTFIIKRNKLKTILSIK